MIDPINAIKSANQHVEALDPVTPPTNHVSKADDSVRLSPAAQVRMLRDEGELLDEIATQLHVPTYEVLSDLGLPSK